VIGTSRSYVAINVYLAFCYYRQDFYDVCLEVLNLYLAQHPDSATALNLKAATNFRLFSGATAQVDHSSYSSLSRRTT